MKPIEKAKKSRGRPPKAQEEVLVQRSIRMTEEQWRKIDSIGLDGLRKMVDRIKGRYPSPP